MADLSASDLPAVVIVAHDKPRQLRRLVAALWPLPIFLHVDANTPDDLHAAMTGDLPDNVTLLPRLSAGWARFEVVEAELAGYRAALARTQARHLILATGADYPLAPVERIVDVLAAQPERSYAEIFPLPQPAWGRMGGFDRFIFRQRPWRQHRLAWPVPRRIPPDLRPSGGAQTKILTRRDAALILDVIERRPDLVRFFRGCWAPDEIVIPTILLSETFEARWEEHGSSDPHPWYIDWGDVPAKSPRWLGMDDLPRIRRAAADPKVPALFARKLADDSDDLVAAIDSQLRSARPVR